jgi:predicted transcriptional regulator
MTDSWQNNFSKPLLSPQSRHDKRRKDPNMKAETYPATVEGTGEVTSLTKLVDQLKENCTNCHPLSPLTCVTDCKIWEQKNELRTLHEKMTKPNFMVDLLNTLKNKRRLQILGFVSKAKQSVPRLQKELKALGYFHSQQTIVQEYLSPLIGVGLAKENLHQYSATLFGSRLNEKIKNNHDVGDILPAHSECYEEIVLCTMLDEPKTYDDFESIIPTKTVARILNRLQKVNLIDATKENDYIFFFQTKRDSSKSELSPTEKRIYENIPADGISARRLCQKTSISLRRTYKYLRKLKGKKLVFTRKRPKTYTLTTRGIQVSSMLRELNELTLEAFGMAARAFGKEEKPESTPNATVKN